MTVYTFTSIGRLRIEKMVEFTNVGKENDDTYKQVVFDPETKDNYEVFIVKRIS